MKKISEDELQAITSDFVLMTESLYKLGIVLPEDQYASIIRGEANVIARLFRYVLEDHCPQIARHFFELGYQATRLKQSDEKTFQFVLKVLGKHAGFMVVPSAKQLNGVGHAQTKMRIIHKFACLVSNISGT